MTSTVADIKEDSIIRLMEGAAHILGRPLTLTEESKIYAIIEDLVTTIEASSMKSNS